GAIVVVDSTFATPYLQQPLELGADIVAHSTTKYLGGHSDLIGGFAATNDPTIAERLLFLQKSLGAVPGPFDSWLVLRGLKTLAVRMRKHCENARAIARPRSHKGTRRPAAMYSRHETITRHPARRARVPCERARERPLRCDDHRSGPEAPARPLWKRVEPEFPALPARRRRRLLPG